MANDSHSHILTQIATNKEAIANLKKDVVDIRDNHLDKIESKVDKLLMWSVGIIVSIILSFGGTVLFVVLK